MENCNFFSHLIKWPEKHKIIFVNINKLLERFLLILLCKFSFSFEVSRN